LRRFRVAGRQIPPRLQPDDVVWHVGGNSKWAGAYQGKAQVLDFFARQAQAMGGMPSVEVHDVLGNDDHVVTLGTAKATARRFQR
jgi:ketosteroid isomerase-like protein